ncbi:ATP-dependent DNA helicase RecG [Parapedobacter pyrenivorans]|uniref:ATP-dependent DNA helicase RecG n=1 Tax=Parapedobacter pyrenivorans TaxID=1305674 RepID=A0A917MFE5_9SPHI|nr:ATP-binding protein [Parapedobacter pyrenivorans]GGG96447.1 ATP-dependent DNA helicase RecG [Parapedobacter pyrenivorans]
MTIEQLKRLRESEDNIEFKEAKRNFPYNGGSHREQSSRRKCVLGYITALSNEGGGMLVLGMADQLPHLVVGTDFAVGKIGETADDIYSRLQMRVVIEELFEGDKRIVVFHVPSRPVGKLMKFEGVPLMRVGDSLRNMSDEEMFKVLSESEPDFSATFCTGVTISDLDDEAMEILKAQYAQKQQNPAFRSLSNLHALNDLGLIIDGKVTYAGLILLGKRDVIQRYLPQAKIILEYRNQESQIPFDWREEICDPLFIAIDRAWQLIHSRNSLDHHSVGPYIFDIQVFDELVIREGLLNSVTHRDYRLTSEVVVKQYPRKLVINNPGGFPKGVSIENLLSVSSTPRSRLIADVLLKTGLVERSGQGVDKIFALTLQQGKPMPDYSYSDPFQVSLVLDHRVINGNFRQFCQLAAEQLDEGEHLGVYEIMTLVVVRDGLSIRPEYTSSLERLVALGLVARVGSNKSKRYVLGGLYEALTAESAKVGNYTAHEIGIIANLFKNKDDTNRMGAIVDTFGTSYTREQVKFLVEKLVSDGVLVKEGRGNTTSYRLAPQFFSNEGNLEGEIYSHLETAHS